MLLLLQLSLVCIYELNSGLQTINVVSLPLSCMLHGFSSFPVYVSCVWSCHNQLFTVHHSGYYNLIFGTTIILQHFNEMFFTLVSLVFPTCNYNVATRILLDKSYSELRTRCNILLFDDILSV